MSYSRDNNEVENWDTVLEHPHRWVTFNRLTDHATMALADLADEIAVWETSSSLEQIPAEDVLVIYNDLYDTHVPALERAGFVEYDEERDLVSLTGYGTDVQVDVSVFADDVKNGPVGGPKLGEASARKETITVELSPETIDAIHQALMTDERFDKEMAYDDVIRAVLTEVYA